MATARLTKSQLVEGIGTINAGIAETVEKVKLSTVEDVDAHAHIDALQEHGKQLIKHAAALRRIEKLIR